MVRAEDEERGTDDSDPQKIKFGSGLNIEGRDDAQFMALVVDLMEGNLLRQERNLFWGC